MLNFEYLYFKIILLLKIVLICEQKELQYHFIYIIMMVMKNYDNITE